MTLDRIDAAILAELQKNARLSNKELAGRIGLAASSCHERVRRLTGQGVLRGAHAEVNPEALGIGLEAMVGVTLRSHSRDVIDSFQQTVDDHPEVVSLYYLAGATDFLIHVAVRDSEHLRDFVMDAVTSRPEVARVETALIFAYTRAPTLPNYQVEPIDDGEPG